MAIADTSPAQTVAQPVQQNPIVVAAADTAAEAAPTAEPQAVAVADPTAIPTDIAAEVVVEAQPTYTAMQIQVPLAEAEPAIDVADNTISTQQWILLATFAAGSVVAFGLLGGMALRSMVRNKEE